MPNDVINTVTVNGTQYGIGGSGGHTIKNPAGTAMTQRSNLQFVDLTISDDSTNDATKVESVHVIHSESELNNLPDGLYMLDEDEGTVIDGNLVGYDNTDSGLNAENVQDAIDEIVEALDDKADKVTNATSGNLAGLNGSGNPTDSGWNGAKDTTSISGNPISISGLKANQLAKNPIITLEPIQAGSGTPSPSNIRAISGYDKIEVLSCGKNLFDKSEVVLGGLDATTGEETSSTTTYRSGWIRVKASTTYVLSGFANVIRPYYFGQGGAFIERDSSTTASTFTTPSGCAYVRFQIASATWTGTSNPQLEEAQTATTYTPYNKTTDLSESLGQTVYGATWYPRTGKLRVTHQIVDLGDLTYTYNSQYQYFYAEISSMADSGYGLSDRYQVTTASYDGNQPDNTFKMSGTGNKRMFITNRAYNDATTFKTAMVGAKVVYELATPFTIQLTPHEISLLSNYAYVSTNGTSISLDYHNGELASLADVSQLGETVNELGEYVGANNLGSQNAIVIPETGNFICPSDGYVVVRSGNNASDFYRVDVYGSQKVSTNRIIIKINSTPDTASKYQYFSVYVRKGMIVTFGEKSSGNTTGGANFVTIE